MAYEPGQEPEIVVHLPEVYDDDEPVPMTPLDARRAEQIARAEAIIRDHRNLLRPNVDIPTIAEEMIDIGRLPGWEGEAMFLRRMTNPGHWADRYAADPPPPPGHVPFAFDGPKLIREKKEREARERARMEALYPEVRHERNRALAEANTGHTAYLFDQLAQKIRYPRM